jgi:hypothetical protein
LPNTSTECRPHFKFQPRNLSPPLGVDEAFTVEELSMKKFLVLYCTPASAKQQMAQATPEQVKAGMELWTSWMKKNGGAVTDLGAPVEAGKRIEAGSVSDGDNTTVGYSIVKSETMITAIKLLHDHPHFHTPGGSIEIFEFLPMPGM